MQRHDTATWDDSHVATMEELASASRHLRDLLGIVADGCDEVVRNIRGGIPASVRQRDAFIAGNRLRLELHDAMGVVETTVRRARSEGIRMLVDSGELTLAEVARLLGISATMAGRLYRAAPAVVAERTDEAAS